MGCCCSTEEDYEYVPIIKDKYVKYKKYEYVRPRLHFPMFIC